jgi:hypothetical protein
LLDKRFSPVLKLSSCRASAANFFGDKFVIRSSIHTARTFNGLFAGALMRRETGWNAAVCLELAGTNYQPKQDRISDRQLVI